MIIRNSLNLNSNQLKNLFNIWNSILLLDFQIFIFQTKVFLDQLNNRLINSWKLSSLDFEWPFALRWKGRNGLILLSYLLWVSLNYCFPIIESSVLDFNYADLRLLFVHILFLGMRFVFIIIKLKNWIWDTIINMNNIILRCYLTFHYWINS